jgi:hypothetical protein
MIELCFAGGRMSRDAFLVSRPVCRGAAFVYLYCSQRRLAWFRRGPFCVTAEAKDLGSWTLDCDKRAIGAPGRTLKSTLESARFSIVSLICRVERQLAVSVLDIRWDSDFIHHGDELR